MIDFQRTFYTIGQWISLYELTKELKKNEELKNQNIL